MQAPSETRGSRIAMALALAIGAAGCLPGDTRPVPERVYATAEPSDAVAHGFDTADGWHVAFDRLLVGIGNVGFEEDDAACNSYAEAHYDRLFDFTVAGREKLSTVYALGTCRLGFRVRQPSFDALLGPGATEADKARMRQRATDRFADDQGVSVFAIGAATRGGEQKRFEWSFRRSFKLTDCAREGGGEVTTVELTEGGSSELRIEVRGEELFRALPDDAAELRFGPIAGADADADGEVTLDDLSQAPRPAVGTGELGPGGGAPDGGVAAPDAGVAAGSLEQLVYEELLPRVLRVVGGGACHAEERSRR